VIILILSIIILNIEMPLLYHASRVLHTGLSLYHSMTSNDTHCSPDAIALNQILELASNLLLYTQKMTTDNVRWVVDFAFSVLVPPDPLSLASWRWIYFWGV